MSRPTHPKSVFINCPFDKGYDNLFNAIVFCVMNCGLFPRCALEPVLGNQVRLQNITSLIESCKFGVHDLSRKTPDKKGKLCRFNMPFELGLFYGAKSFGSKKQKSKECIIMDSKKYEYQKFISDLAGIDARSHRSAVKTIVRELRDWIFDLKRNPNIPGAEEIMRRYGLYNNNDLKKILRRLRRQNIYSLTFVEKRIIIAEWLEVNGFSIELMLLKWAKNP